MKISRQFSVENKMVKKIIHNRNGQVPGDYYHKSINGNILQRFWHSRRFIEVKRFIKGLKAKKILDVGCHGGKLTFEIYKQFPDAEIFGIDISSNAIAFAKHKYPLMHFEIADAEKLPYNNNQFDLVTCFEVMEHINNPKRALAEVHRVLKKNGNYLILVPTENLLFRVIWFFWTLIGPGRIWKHTHVQKFQNHTLDFLLKTFGFRVVKRKLFMLGMLLLIQAKKE